MKIITASNKLQSSSAEKGLMVAPDSQRDATTREGHPKKLGTLDTLQSPEVIQHTPITSVDTDGGTFLKPNIPPKIDLSRLHSSTRAGI